MSSVSNLANLQFLGLLDVANSQVCEQVLTTYFDMYTDQDYDFNGIFILSS